MNIRGHAAPPPARIEPASPDRAEAIGDVYLSAWAEALAGVHRPHTDGEVRAWLRDVAMKRARTWVALDGAGAVVGFVMLAGAAIDQLFVRPGHYRRGIGAALLATATEAARRERATEIRLFTFARNARARAFYEAQGFTVASTSDGARNEEREPDIEYVRRLGVR
jgi:ribosomal protein S18 acetylase RimI-like enzyme